MDSASFRDNVASAITSRRVGELSPEQLSDWHYHVKDLHEAEAKKVLEKFFREFDGAKDASRFGGWLKRQNVRKPERPADRFDCIVADWPECSMIRMIDNRKSETAIRFGWIERSKNSDRGFVFMCKNGQWFVAAFRPCDLDRQPVDISAFERSAPASWVYWSHRGQPEELEALLLAEGI